ncbi:MAG: AMP-binding protein [Desulfotomaculales bacterium]
MSPLSRPCSGFLDREGRREEKLTFAKLDRLGTTSPTSCRAWECRRATGWVVLLPKVPELVAAILGCWKLGAVYVPLFTALARRPFSTACTNAEPRCWLPITSTVTGLTRPCGPNCHCRPWSRSSW